MKKFLWVVVAAIVVVALASLSKGSKNDLKGQVVKIGADFSLTSFGAAWGENNLKGAQLAVKEINAAGGVLGSPVELVVEDNKSEGKSSVTAVNKLISIDKVDFLLTGWSDQTEPIIPIIDKSKLITITVSAGAADIAKKSTYLFRTWPSDAIAIKSLLQHAKALGAKRVAVANSIGAWENSLSDVFEELARIGGFEFVGKESFQINDVDMKAQIAKLKAEKPDAIFIPATNGPAQRFISQAGDQGLSAPLLYPVDLFSLGVEGKVSPKYLANVIYAVYAPSRESFVKAFKAEYGTNPGVAADTAYDAVKMIARAVQKAGSKDASKVASSFSIFDGASGRIEFDEFGDRKTADVFLMTFKEGKPVQIK